MDNKGNPCANYTLDQYIALNQVKRDLEDSYPNAKWYGHYELDSGKACPCFDIHSLLGV